MISVLLTVASAVLTHIGIRGADSRLRALLLSSALLVLGVAFYLSDISGGFWSGVYTLLSVYFLACLITPWIGLLWRSGRAS